MKILVAGKDGQLGWELTRTLQTHGEVIAVGREQMNLADADSIRNAIRATHPDLIVNAAAYTAVDRAETEEDLAYAINAIAPGVMAEEAKRIGAGIIHYSTDYVFDGTKDIPYVEEDEPNPLNAYGRSKLAGERAVADTEVPHLILRTSWVYGARGKNFLRTILRLARERDKLSIVNDQIGAPTWTKLIAQATSHILATHIPLPQVDGLFHLTAGGATSWFGFANAIIDCAKSGKNLNNLQLASVVPIPTSDYPAPATRPANSRLCCDKLARQFGLFLPDWTTEVHLCMQEL